MSTYSFHSNAIALLVIPSVCCFALTDLFRLLLHSSRHSRHSLHYLARHYCYNDISFYTHQDKSYVWGGEDSTNLTSNTNKFIFLLYTSSVEYKLYVDRICRQCILLYMIAEKNSSEVDCCVLTRMLRCRMLRLIQHVHQPNIVELCLRQPRTLGSCRMLRLLWHAPPESTKIKINVCHHWRNPYKSHCLTSWDSKQSRLYNHSSLQIISINQ